jgi:hypothetical protein
MAATPDIDELFRQQATERDHAKREALLDTIEQLTIDRVMYAPVIDFRALMGSDRGSPSIRSAMSG